MKVNENRLTVSPPLYRMLLNRPDDDQNGIENGIGKNEMKKRKCKKTGQIANQQMEMSEYQILV